MDARGISGAIAVALHALVAAALLSYEPARSAVFAAAPIMISLITTPRAEPEPEPPVEIPPPKPRRVAKKPKPPEPVMIAAPTPAPAEISAPPLLPEPPPAPEPEPIAAPPAPPAPVVEVPPEPITPPIFDARYLDNPQPRYPTAALRSGQQGRVVLRVHVTPGGIADEVEVRDSSGYLRLDEAARDAVRKWRFVPAKRGAQPIPAWVLVPISFRLKG